MAAGAILLWPGTSEHPIPTQFRSADGGPIKSVDGEIVGQVRGDCLNPLSGTVQSYGTFQIESTSGTAPCIQNVVSITSGPDAAFPAGTEPTVPDAVPRPHPAETPPHPDHDLPSGGGERR